MMKYSLALLAYLATVSIKGANAVPLSEVVSSVITKCPDIAAALTSPDFSTLSSLLTTAGDTDIILPEGKKEIIIAPTNAAFENLLTKLGVTAEELISSDLFVPTLATHIAIATNNGASQADTVAGSKIRLYQGQDTTTKLPLLNVGPGVVAGIADTVQGPMNKATAFQTINCQDGTYVFAVDTVLEPKEIANGQTPAATAPETVPVAPTVPEVAVPPVPEVAVPEVPVVAVPPVPEVAPVEPSPSPSPIPSPSPSPMPMPTPTPSPPATPVVPTASATGLKAAIGSAMAVVAAVFM